MAGRQHESELQHAAMSRWQHLNIVNVGWSPGGIPVRLSEPNCHEADVLPKSLTNLAELGV